jgi:hypothetical protein
VVSSGAEALGFGQFATRVTTTTLLEALTAAVAWQRRGVSLPHANEIWLETQHLNAAHQAPTGGAARRRQRSRQAPRSPPHRPYRAVTQTGLL